jgi:hypothetical protein
MERGDKVSDQIVVWLNRSEPKTVGSLVALFKQKSFALIFVFLLGVPALPAPTGGVTHVFEVMAMLLALQLIVGRDELWVPQRWRCIDLYGPKQQRFVNTLLKVIRWLERFSRPRLRHLFEHRLTSSVFGLLAFWLSIAAFLAPPFSGLDTLPALGVVVMSLGVLLQDFALAIAGVAIGTAGVAAEVVLGRAAFTGIKDLFSILFP